MEVAQIRPNKHLQYLFHLEIKGQSSLLTYKFRYITNYIICMILPPNDFAFFLRGQSITIFPIIYMIQIQDKFINTLVERIIGLLLGSNETLHYSE